MFTACKTVEQNGVGATTPPVLPTATQDDAIASNHAAAEVFFAVYNTKEYDDLDVAVAPDFRRQGPAWGAESLAKWKTYLSQLHTTYPDFHIEMLERVFDGDTGAVQWEIAMTDAETGRSIVIPGMSLFQFENGMITEHLSYYDPAPLHAQ
jgi:hypothetical protein